MTFLFFYLFCGMCRLLLHAKVLYVFISRTVARGQGILFDRTHHIKICVIIRLTGVTLTTRHSQKPFLRGASSY